MLARLKEKYEQDILPGLQAKLGRKNRMSIPRLEKIVVNMGVGRAVENRKRLEAAVADLTRIAGQKPVITRARRSVSNFKLRQGMEIGCKVTLRRERMYEFFDRLVAVVIPRIRDFRGLSQRAFDGRGNYAFGLQEQSVFPEIDLDKLEHQQGMDICIVTSADNDTEALELLRAFGMPFRN
jgi:large subunit ribosomal protein L5